LEPKPAPAKWGKFDHLDPAHYMDYYYAIEHAPKGGAVDVDGRNSKQGTMWALHWPTIAQNHLHDPLKLLAGTRRIDSLSDAEINRLQSAEGKKPHKMQQLLVLAWNRRVRIELELKTYFPLLYIKKLMAVAEVSALHKAQLLQFKTLAKISGCISRLTPVQHAGGVTILSFTGYTGTGISKLNAWPVTDYYRGTPKWR
jgi:hypothetical protein